MSHLRHNFFNGNQKHAKNILVSRTKFFGSTAKTCAGPGVAAWLTCMSGASTRAIQAGLASITADDARNFSELAAIAARHDESYPQFAYCLNRHFANLEVQRTASERCRFGQPPHARVRAWPRRICTWRCIPPAPPCRRARRRLRRWARCRRPSRRAGYSAPWP